MDGIRMVPTAATVPGPDPEMAAKKVQARMVVMPSPPCILPTICLTTSTICCVMLPYSMRVPATTKQGMASNGKRLSPSNRELWMTDMGRTSPLKSVTAAAMARDMKMGTPSRKRTAMHRRASSSGLIGDSPHSSQGWSDFRSARAASTAPQCASSPAENRRE